MRLIGVISKPGQLNAVEEFFQLFKTPWEYCRPGGVYSAVIATRDDVPEVNAPLLLIYGADAKSIDARLGITRGERPRTACLNHQGMLVPIYGEACTFTSIPGGCACVMAGTNAIGVSVTAAGSTVIRIGYDLFEEVGHLLSNGQPIENAGTPTLDVHIQMLRTWILEAGNSLVEIPSVPSGYSFTACLTHDIDFVGIRNHKLDHTMLGFLYRSTVGTVKRLVLGKLTVQRMLQAWRAAFSLPAVYVGLVKDFWEPFAWYLKVEKDLPATYFLIPFKRRAGNHVPGANASRRATAYDVTDLADQIASLRQHGCELGVHGIDAWHSAQQGRAELTRVRNVTGASEIGIRMHWLLHDSGTYAALEDAGFAYDSTAGYNETVGYRNGTTQVFRPLTARTLLELPMHIQDGALFFHNRLDLSATQARDRCQPLFDNAQKYGGVLTFLWHDRSHGPERFWGDFYLELVQKLKARNVWFGSAGQVVGWFGKRREVQFEQVESAGGLRVRVRGGEAAAQPPLVIRAHTPGASGPARESFVDVSWDGAAHIMRYSSS